MYVWPSAVVLAQYLWTHREQLRDATVLEVKKKKHIELLDKRVLSDNCVHSSVLCLCSSVQVWVCQVWWRPGAGRRWSCPTARGILCVWRTAGAAVRWTASMMWTCWVSPGGKSHLTSFCFLNWTSSWDQMFSTSRRVCSCRITLKCEQYTARSMWTPCYILLIHMWLVENVSTYFRPCCVTLRLSKHVWPVSDFEDVIVTVAFLLRKNPRAQFWTTYQQRRSSTERCHTYNPVSLTCSEPCGLTCSSSSVCFSADWSMEALLHRWNMNCVEVRLETFAADKSELAGSSLPGSHSIDMMIITLKSGEDEQRHIIWCLPEQQRLSHLGQVTKKITAADVRRWRKCYFICLQRNKHGEFWRILYV